MFGSDETLIRKYAEPFYAPMKTAETITKLYRKEIEWLGNLGVQLSAIANFGCNNGRETLALTRLLDTSGVIGIDINKANIEQAQQDTATLRDAY